MRHPLWFALAAAFAALPLAACTKEEPPPPPAAAKPPAPAPKPPPPAAAPKPAPAANPGGVMTPDEASAQGKALMGKRIKIKGYYFNYTKQGDQLNVSVLPAPDIATKGPLCVFPGSAKAALDKVTQKSQITVSGVVKGEFFGKPKLEDCKLE